MSSKPPTPVKMIIDTDLEFDVDDVGAIALSHILADRGEVELLGMVVSCGHAWSPLCLSAMNMWYGRPDLPVGFVGEKGTVIMGSKYAQRIAEQFPRRLRHAGEAEPSTPLFRRLLAGQPDGSVTLVSIGFMTGLRWLLESGPDEISPLSGRELVARKLKCWVCMGGGYPQGREYNFIKDSRSAHHCVNTWPTPIYFTGEELGKQVLTGEGLSALPEENPTRIGYELYFDGTLKDRPSWDQITVLFAARLEEMLGDRGLWEVIDKGGNRVEEDGSNHWDPGFDAPHFYLKPRLDLKKVERIIEELMIQTPAYAHAGTQDGSFDPSKG